MTSHTQGPVPLDSKSYIERAFETELIRATDRKESILLLGPRQHGKTSALLRYCRGIRSKGYLVAYVDLQKLPPQSTYEELLECIAREIWKQINPQKQVTTKPGFLNLGGLIKPGVVSDLTPPDHKSDLRDWLDSVITPGESHIVIVIDEAASIRNDELRNSFYGQIRALTNENATAQKHEIASRLRFVFSGTFRPESLVDPLNSPFNVCLQLETENLSIEQVKELCTLILGSDYDDISSPIWDYVGGQPFLVQKILSEIEVAPEGPTTDELERAISKLDEDTAHVSGILSKVIEDESLIAIVTQVIENGYVDIAPADNDMKYLRTLGLLTRDQEKLVCLNKYYERMARAAPQLSKIQVAEGSPKRALYELQPEEFAQLNSAEIREFVQRAHRGSVLAYNTESFRLALTGFGAAFEGVLIDWLTNAAQADLQTAIGSSNPNFDQRFEDATKPVSWRLVNLVKVGRALAPAIAISEADIPDALRDWRNSIHPSVVIQDYEPEESLEEAAAIAEGMFRRALRLTGQP